MTFSDTEYWKSTIRMCEMAMQPRAEKWRKLKKRLGVDFGIDGVKDPVYISRFYKIVRETIASVAFRHPFIYVKAEEDPADPEGEVLLDNASPILQDFANDALEIMDCKRKVKQALFDAVFCFRGWLKFGFCPPSGILAPYIGSDTMRKDFTCILWVRPEHVLTDPLVDPHDFYTSRYVIHKMFPSLDQLIGDERFKNFETQLQGLKGKTSSAAKQPFDPWESEWERASDEGKSAEVLKEAHRLANSRCVYEVQDRIKQRQYVFVDGLEQPVEDKEHPFLKQEMETEPDPITGKPLMTQIRNLIYGDEPSGPPAKRAESLIKGGLTFLTLSLDVSDEFYGTSIMEYANPLQNAIIKKISRDMLLQERFKRHPIIKKQEMDDNPNLVNILKDGEDGEPIPLNDVDAIKPEVPWGNPPPGADRLEQSLLSYEADTIRTTASSLGADTATGEAVAASETEMNRLYSQDSVEGIYIDITHNVFSVMSDPRFEPDSHFLRIAPEEGGNVTRQALKAWMLKGRWNVNTAAGSSNILYEAMNKDKAAWVVDRLRNSTNVDQLKLDKYIIRAGGEIEPGSLLKDAANIDAAKAAELENQMILVQGHDPGVTPGEDHRTHMSVQHPNAIAQHPQFAQLQPEQQQMAVRLATQHHQAHQQALATEASGSGRPEGGGNGRTTTGSPQDLLGQVQSNAQRTQDVVSKEAEEMPRR